MSAQETALNVVAGGPVGVLGTIIEPMMNRTRDSPPCPWNKATTAAAQEGYLEVLKWARGQDPPDPWDRFTCSFAAVAGHL